MISLKKNNPTMKRFTASVCLLLFFLTVSCAGLQPYSSAPQAFEKGLALFHAQKYEEAIPYFQKAVELDARYADAYLYLGKSYAALNRWSDALDAFKEAVRLLPDNVEAWLGLAKTYYADNDPVEALRAALEALDLDARSRELGEILFAIGQKLLSRGLWEEAIPAFKGVLQIIPEKYEAFIGLAEAFLKSGKVQKAIETLKKVLKIDPNSKEARELLLQLLRQR